MLVPKTIQVEQNIDAIMTEIKNVIIALKAGKSITDIGLQELLKLQQLVQELQGCVDDVKESLPAAIRTATQGVEELIFNLLGVS